jgi:hypothetical protein
MLIIIQQFTDKVLDRENDSVFSRSFVRVPSVTSRLIQKLSVERKEAMASSILEKVPSKPRRVCEADGMR